MSDRVCFFVSVCQDDLHYLSDWVRWTAPCPFVVLFDRCPTATWGQVFDHPRCRGTYAQEDPAVEFEERLKQPLLNRALEVADWAFGLDVDERLEEGFFSKLLAALDAAEALPKGGADYAQFRWLNLWNDRQHIRRDGEWLSHKRACCYRGQGRQWVFDHPITNGAKLQGRTGTMHYTGEPAILHAGMMTAALRREHKARWDRIYGTALNGDKNPYGFWNWAIETEGAAEVAPHGLFPEGG